VIGRAALLVALPLAAACLGPQVSDEVEEDDFILPAGTQVPVVDDDPELARRIDEHDGVDGVVPLVSGFAGGEAIRYWDLGPAPDFAMPVFVLARRGPNNELVRVDHPPILVNFPGDAGYSPYWVIFTVEVSASYAGQVLPSLAALNQAQEEGLVSGPGRGDRNVNGPIFARGVVIETGGAAPPVEIPYYWNGMRGTYYFFGATALAADGVHVPETPLYVLRREGGDPLSEPARGIDMNDDGDIRDSNNVLGVAGDDPAFSPLCAETLVTVPGGTASIDGDETPAIRGADQLFAGSQPLTPPVLAVRPAERRFNCPVQAGTH